MEFTESFPITQNGSTNGQIILSPCSRLIAISEFFAADRRIGSNAEEVLPAWRVRIIETDTLGVMREFHIKLPVEIVNEAEISKDSLPRDSYSYSSSEKNKNNKKRQFVMGGLVTKSGTTGTITSPKISHNLLMEWSPNGRFLAAWPQDTALIYIMCPETLQYNNNDPLLIVQELTAIGIANYQWSPDSIGILVNLKFGMGIKYWRLDCKYPVHLFPYPKATEKDGIVFSEDGKYLGILHRRDGVDHVAVYCRTEPSGDWKVLHWLNVPEDVNLEGISFARGSSESQYDQVPLLYAWESFPTFHLLIYDGTGTLKCHVNSPDTEISASFGIKNWQWCGSGRLAVFSDSQDFIYLWNAVNHKLMGKISLGQLDVLKSQNPIVFKEQPMRESNCVKYEASYTFPLQSQMVSTSSSHNNNIKFNDPRYEISFDGEYLAVHDANKYPNCLWIFDLKAFKLKALLVQLKSIQDFLWHPNKNVLTAAIGSDHIYFWQPDGTHCIPHPIENKDVKSSNVSLKSVKWIKNQQKNVMMLLMSGNDNFCLGVPEIL